MVVWEKWLLENSDRQRCNWGGVPVVFLTAFTFPNPEESQVPIPCWENEESQVPIPCWENEESQVPIPCWENEESQVPIPCWENEGPSAPMTSGSVSLFLNEFPAYFQEPDNNINCYPNWDAAPFTILSSYAPYCFSSLTTIRLAATGQTFPSWQATGQASYSKQIGSAHRLQVTRKTRR